MASNPIVNMFKVKELRSRMLFTLLILAIFRLGSVLTIPGIDANVLLQYFDNLAAQNRNAFASYMDFFVGGAFSNFSIFMLGVMPYISMQIIMWAAQICDMDSNWNDFRMFASVLCYYGLCKQHSGLYNARSALEI